MSSYEKRLAEIESRLSRLEAAVGSGVRPESEGTDTSKVSATPQPPPLKTEDVEWLTPPPLPSDREKHMTKMTAAESEKNLSVTNILGWAGATALVLAAAYLIRLAIDSGWLTPARQIGLAMMGGLALIGTGLGLRKSNHQYASLLPAGGVVVLFLSIYGAHLYYHLIDAATALGAVILVNVVSLWLCKVFRNELYALFAAVGSYSAPLLLPSLGSDVTDLVIYFSSWSIIFCVYALWLDRRRVYILALYLALIGFDFIWRSAASHQWIEALVFQTVQLVIFAGCATFFSIKRKMPMTTQTALAHLPAVLIFYGLQYALLDKYIPAYAPWIAAGSAAVIGICYMTARVYLRQGLEGGRLLLSTYCALVLFHAGYIESVPAQFEPWVALVLLPLVAAYGFIRRRLASVGWPVWIAVGVIFMINYLRIILNWHLESVPWNSLLSVLFAVELYLGYYFMRRMDSDKKLIYPLLYSGHISLMAAALHLYDSRFIVSLAWGGLGLLCLIVSLSKQDKILGQSSLFVFAVSAAKLLLYDLSEAAPLVRIACLIVLGITYYLGGWLYRKVNAMG